MQTHYWAERRLCLYLQYGTSESRVGKGYPHSCDSAVGNHSCEDILYQPDKRKCHIAFIQQFYDQLIEFDDTRFWKLSNATFNSINSLWMNGMLHRTIQQLKYIKHGVSTGGQESEWDCSRVSSLMQWLLSNQKCINLNLKRTGSNCFTNVFSQWASFWNPRETAV